MNNSIYFKRDDFYYISILDPQRIRNNKLSNLFNENIEEFYIGKEITTNLSKARFWKDLGSAKWFIKKYSKDTLPRLPYMAGMNFKCEKTNTEFIIHQINRDEFLNIIPNSYDDEKDFVTNRNLRIKNEEILHKNRWTLLRSKYKAIKSYVKVRDPKNWIPCKNCGLIPLIWEFDNGRSTACGCGKNEYDHHSIKAESITSYMKRNGGSMLGYNGEELRMNWNEWVINGT